MFDRYLIKNGENLEQIAKRFNTDTDYLMDINNIFYIDSLKSGQEIIVPKIGKEYYDYYTVLEGDNLINLSRKYNINPELLSNINGLNMEDYIYPNQEILIPKSNYSYYITKEGDTLDTSSNIFNTDIKTMLELNETIYLLPGQLLVNKK